MWSKQSTLRSDDLPVEIHREIHRAWAVSGFQAKIQSCDGVDSTQQLEIHLKSTQAPAQANPAGFHKQSMGRQQLWQCSPKRDK